MFSKQKKEIPMTPQRLESYALFLLGRQDYTSRKMAEKLGIKYPKKQFDDSESVISSLMNKLVRLNYINDERYLLSAFNALLKQNIGQVKIRQKLLSKGFAADDVEKVLSDRDGDDEDDFFLKALAFKKRKFGDAPILDRTQSQKALRTLVSKGFSFSDSLKAIKHVPEDH